MIEGERRIENFKGIPKHESNHKRTNLGVRWNNDHEKMERGSDFRDTDYCTATRLHETKWIR